MPFLMLVEDMSDDIIWPLALLEKSHALPNFSRWMKAGLQHESVLDKVQREPRKEFVRARLSEVRDKYAQRE